MLNILVIDDEANIRKTLALWLKSHGRQVCQAGDVQAALAESRARMFEMAFLDLRRRQRFGTDSEAAGGFALDENRGDDGLFLH